MLSYAENEAVRTVQVTGEYTVLSNSSKNEWHSAPELAHKDAQKKALEKVCGSTITIWDQMEISSDKESFNSLAILQSFGDIVDFEVIKEWTEKSSVRDIETTFYCKAKVTVKKGVSPDPTFYAQVSGLKKGYYNNEQLKFSIKTTIDCYLNVFLFIDEKTGYKLYPNQLEQTILLNANTLFSFPTREEWEYTITKDTNEEFEANRLLFVFTKDNMQYISESNSRQDIMQWIAKIKNDTKYIYSCAFDIRER